jgi:hypothetical protein
VPNVVIEATHLQTNYRFTAQSNDVGVYTLAQLREGDYTLRATASGFEEYAAQNIRLVSRDLRRIDIQLRIGSVETVVEVTAGATLIETETACIGDTKNASTLQSLPLNTRSLYDVNRELTRIEHGMVLQKVLQKCLPSCVNRSSDRFMSLVCGAK